MDDALFFFRHFLRHPVQISSLIPTSRAIADYLAKKIPKKKGLVIVEYGPGTGVLARAILRSGRLLSDSKLILIEKTEEFADRLRKKIKDPRVIVSHSSAEHVAKILKSHGETNADIIFSSIPFSLMPKEVVDQVLEETHDVLEQEGRFVVFLFRHDVEKLLEKSFGKVKTEFRPINIPPLFIFEVRKKSN